MTTDLLLSDQLRSRQGGVWAYLSASRLNCWLSCPLKFRFQYLDGLRPPPTSALFLGKIVHRALEAYYRHRHLGVTLDAGDVCRRILEMWGPMVDEEGMTFDSPAEEQALQKQADNLVTAYLGYVSKDEKPLAVEVALEAPLVDPATGEGLGLPLVGIVDLVLDAQDGAVITDFKTSSRSSEPLEVFHEVQLTAYSYLFRQTCDRPEAGLEIRSLIKTKVPKIEIHGYPARTEAHFQRLFSIIREYLDALDANRFNFRPGFHCGLCDFQDQCGHWSGSLLPLSCCPKGAS